MKTAIILFALTYVLMLAFQKYRPVIAVTSAVLFIISGILPINKVLSYIDWNVLMMIAGTMGTVSLVIKSGLPSLIADHIIRKVSSVRMAIVTIALFAGIVSAFIDNVATVLMIAPIALSIAKKLNISPVGMVIAIAVSSNLQGAATLVGDTTSMLLGSYAGMNFADFFVYQGKSGIFFAVQMGAVISAVILLWVFRKETAAVSCDELTKVDDFVPGVLLVANIVLLILASLVPNSPEMANGIICVVVCVEGAIYHAVRNKQFRALWEPIAEIDFATVTLLAGLFLVIGGITEAGVVSSVAEIFTTISNGNLFVIYTVIVWMSVVLSAFIDNIPYVATMLPVVQQIAITMGIDPTLLYFGLLSGATLGGNLTPIGASANITGIGILRKEGWEVKNTDFLKIGVPFTLAAVIPAYIYFWLIYV